MKIHRSTFLAAALVLVPVAVSAQSVVIDEGTFRILLDGRDAGTEEFTIRRAGLGPDATIFAHAVVKVDVGDGGRELRPVLEVLPPEGTASSYQLKISGSETTDVTVRLAGTRYASLLRSEVGEEEREFLARPETRIVEAWVAHQYYFLRNVREGSRAPVIEPRTRKQAQLVAGAWTDDRLRIGGTEVGARRVDFTAGSDVRSVWFDQQGRVLRVEIPALKYRAERQDLAG